MAPSVDQFLGHPPSCYSHDSISVITNMYGWNNLLRAMGLVEVGADSGLAYKQQLPFIATEIQGHHNAD